MCLGIPGQVVEISTSDEHLARVEVSGAGRIVNIGLLADEVLPGDWVLVHVGFAMAKIDEDEAAAALGALAAMGRDYRDEVDSFRSTAPWR